jgi:hypothetical protein
VVRLGYSSPSFIYWGVGAGNSILSYETTFPGVVTENPNDTYRADTALESNQ